jgi:hypothetical protein
MSVIKYSDAIPIRPRLHTVWLIITRDEKRIAIWGKDAEIEDVCDFYKARGFRKFRVGLLGVGEHIISQTEHSYMDDVRFVDQDGNVVLLK